MAAAQTAGEPAAMAYTAEDWQAQLEEVLALQSIFADDFRVTHIPGQNPAASSSNTTDATSSLTSSRRGSSADGSDSATIIEDIEQLVESLPGSEPPDTTAVGLLTCEAIVHVELPAGHLQIVLDMQNRQQVVEQFSPETNSTSCCTTGACNSPSTNSSSSSNSSSRMPFGPPISYLPPFCVQLSLPRNYPSCESAPPRASIQACWLSQQQEQQLQDKLQELWMEQGPGPICFSWLDYLKTDALSALELVKELLLQPQQQTQQQVLLHAQQQLQEQAPQAQQQQQHTPLQKSAGVHSSSGSATAGSTSADSGNGVKRTGNTHEGRKPGLSPAAAPFSPGNTPQAGQNGTTSKQQQQHDQHGQGSRRHRTGRQRNEKQQQQQQQQQLLLQQEGPSQPQQQPGQQGSAVGSSEPDQQTAAAARPGSAALQEAQQQQQQQQQLHMQEQQQMDAVEQLAVQLLRYSAAQEAEAFRESTQTCLICFEQVPGAECLQLPECGHFYCINCLKHHATAQMDQGSVENMRCPEPSCRRPFQPYVIKELLGEAGYTRWEELLLQRTLDKMEDVVYCPRCDTVCIEDSDHCAQCSKCLYVFCSFCSDSWHPGTECLDPHERLRILERRKKATGAGDKHHEMDLVNQLMNLKYLSSNTRKCPSCGMATIKNEGCNKMTCVYCGSNWCWKCQQVIQGYDHFKDSRCNMFDQEEINRWNAMMWANERAREVEFGQFQMQVRMHQNPGVRLCRCPVCGQENLREGKNNLLRCWSCNCHFCYSCRSWLRGKVGQHFAGPKAPCKQHGD